MPNLKTNPLFSLTVACGGLLAAVLIYGCQSQQNPPATQTAAAPTTQPVEFALFGPPPHKAGAQLWADNCMRCHNGRSPDEFSPAQWETIVHHMRLRANLTGEEAREVTKFLQATH